MEKRKNQGQEWEDEEVIDLGEIFYALLRKLWVIIAVAVLGAGIGEAYSYFLLTPQYSSTAKIYVLTKETTLTSLADLQIGTQLTQDYKTIITGRSVMEEVVDKLHLDMDYKELVRKIKVENPYFKHFCTGSGCGDGKKNCRYDRKGGIRLCRRDHGNDAAETHRER